MIKASSRCKSDHASESRGSAGKYKVNVSLFRLFVFPLVHRLSSAKIFQGIAQFNSGAPDASIIAQLFIMSGIPVQYRSKFRYVRMVWKYFHTIEHILVIQIDFMFV
jgi:hypothetical protein